MAKVDDLTIKVNVESLLQKEIIDVVEKIQRDHGLTIDSINFYWAKSITGDQAVVRVETTSSYERQ